MAFGKKRNFVIIVFTFVFLLTGYKGLLAAQKSWDGGASTSLWSDGNNWNPDGVPGASDSVTIDNSASTIVDGGFSNTIANLVIGGATAGSVQLQNSLVIAGALTINDNGTLDAGSQVLSLDVATTHTFNGTFTMGTSTISLADNGAYTFTSNESNINFYNLNYVAATAGTNSLTFVSTGSTNFIFNGTFEKGARATTVTAGSGATLQYGNGGILKYSSSLISMSVGDEWPADYPQLVQKTGTQTVNFSGTRTVDSLTINNSSGAFSIGSGSLTINDLLTITAGALNNSGTLTYGSGSTIVYNGSSPQTVGDEWTSTLEPDNVTINNSGNTITAGSSRTVPIVLTLTAGTISCSGDTLTVLGDVSGSDVAGSGSISSTTYLSMGDGVMSASDQTISGSITLNRLIINKETTSGVVQLTGSLNFTGTTPTLNVTQGIFDANGRTISGSYTLSVANGSTFRTGATNISGATLSLVNGSNFEFDGSTAENAPSATYGNIIVNNSSSSGVTLGGNITFSTNSKLNVSAGRRVNLNGISFSHGASDSLIVNSGATLYTDGTAITGFSGYALDGTVRFNGDGSGQETAPAATFNNVRINNGDGLTLAGNVTINGTLTFTLGKITSTSVNLLTLGSSATATATSTSFVTGPVARSTDGSTTSFSFPIGVSSSLRTASLSFASAPAVSNTITAEAFGSVSSPTSNLSGVSSVENDGYWQITSTEGSPPNYTATLTTTNFSPSISGGSNVSIVRGSAADTYNDQLGSSASPGTDVVSANFTGGFSYFAIANLTGTVTWKGGTGNWSVATNWNGDVVPQTGDDVIIGVNGSNVTYDGSVSPTTFSSLSLSGGVTLTLSLQSFDFSGMTVTVGNGDNLVFNGTTITNYSSANTDYQTGSTVQYTTGTINGDTYSNLTINTTGSLSSSTAVVVNSTFTKSGSGSYDATSSLDVNGGVVLNAGTVTPTGGATITGNITSNGGNFSSSSGTVTLDGSSQQSISGATPLTFNNLTLNNSGGLSISQNDTVSGVFTFTSGIVTTGSNALVIGTAGSIGGTVDNSHYVSGRVTKLYAAGVSSFTYPTGKDGQQLDVTLNVNVATAPYIRTVEQFNSSAVGLDPDIDASLSAVSMVRYWEISAGGGSLGGFPTVTLEWNSHDAIDASLTALDVAQLSGGVWTSIGGDGSGTFGSGTITSNAIMSSGDYYTFGDDANNGQDNSLPVELTSFTAIADYGKVVLNWQTASEIENLGFNIFRKESSAENWQQINTQLINGQGNSSVAKDYSFEDEKVQAGNQYSYKLESVSYDGSITVEKTIDVLIPVPEKITLFNNYPNPFNPSTNIKFQLPRYSTVNLSIYDMSGKLVKVLLKDAAYDAGQFVVNWDATDSNENRVSSGMYVYRFNAGSYTKMGRMLLIK